MPASAWVSNWINDTYENSYNINTELVEESKKAVEDSLKNAEESDIILMHDCYETSVTAALQIVDDLQKQGYTFVTVEEILLD